MPLPNPTIALAYTARAFDRLTYTAKHALTRTYTPPCAARLAGE